MKVLIVGLGLMGGAYAYRLRDKGYTVYGADLNQNSIDYAIKNGFIDEGATDPEGYIKEAEIIILAIYPRAILSFIEKYRHLFNPKQVITDISGIKGLFVYEAEKAALPAKYVSHHPMAGREKIGIEYSKEVVFEGANFLVTVTETSDTDSIDVMMKLGYDLGFARITVIDIDTHDDMVGFTSQLTHAIAVSLVNSDHNPDTKNFIGDSYRDLTRIAKINENLWSELFLGNKQHLLDHIQSFEVELDRIKTALNNDDKEALKEIFKSATLIRKAMEK